MGTPAEPATQPTQALIAAKRGPAHHAPLTRPGNNTADELMWQADKLKHAEQMGS
jgi:hypothetical protein